MVHQNITFQQQPALEEEEGTPQVDGLNDFEECSCYLVYQRLSQVFSESWRTCQDNRREQKKKQQVHQELQDKAARRDRKRIGLKVLVQCIKGNIECCQESIQSSELISLVKYLISCQMY